MSNDVDSASNFGATGNITPLFEAQAAILNFGMRSRFLNGWILVALTLSAGFGLSFACASAEAQETNRATYATTNDPEKQKTWKLMEEYFAALERNNVTNASELGRRTLAQGTNDAVALNFMSWRIFHDRHIRHRDRELALSLSQRAIELTKENNPEVLDNYARALWENGKREEAIRYEEKAVALCKEEAKRIDMEANLNRYRRLIKQAANASGGAVPRR